MSNTAEAHRHSRAWCEGCTLCCAGANAMALSLMKGKRITLSKVDAFADGVAVKQASRALSFVLLDQMTCCLP